MSSIFGLPTSTLLIILIVLFALCMSAFLSLFFRNRVIFYLGARNIPRRPAQTVLIVLGLMLSTLIIASAFTTGDTLNHSIRSQVLNSLGPTDEVVVLSGGDGDDAVATLTGAQVPQEIATDLTATLAEHPQVDGVLPILSEPVPAINQRTGLSEASILMTGLDPRGVGSFGGLLDVDRQPIDVGALAGIVLSESAAEELDAVVGDAITIYANNLAHNMTVDAIAPDSMLTGSTGAGTAGFALPLETAQRIVDAPGMLSYIAISNVGGVESGVQHTDVVVAAVNDALDGTPYRALPHKQHGLEVAEYQGEMFLQMFLIFGLFSVSVGILLIFLIFVMLAAERRPEIGMARAVGLKRRQVTEMFLAEGIIYDVIAAFVGAILGVGIAFVMVQVLQGLFGNVLDIQPTVTWRSLLIAYLLGVVVTFITIVISSWKVSKVNITAAIRDVPDRMRVREGRAWLVAGIAGTIIGGLLFWAGAQSGNALSLSMGISLVPLGIAAILRRFGVPARPLYTVVSLIVLLYWVLPESVTEPFLPETDGGMEMFLASGLMMVAASTLLIIWNAEIIVDAMGLIGRAFSSWLPAVRTAVAYPMANRVRTGMTIAMFSLVVFSLVMMAAIITNIVDIFSSEDAGGGWTIQASHSPTNPIDDFQVALQDNGVDTNNIEQISRTLNVGMFRSQVRQEGVEDWSTYNVNGVDRTFIEHSEIALQIRATGYDSDAAVFEAMRADPTLAIVDPFVFPAVGFGPDSDQFVIEGVRSGDTSMEPTILEIADPATGRSREVTVIGIMDSKVFALFGIFMSEEVFTDIFEQPQQLTYYVALTPGSDAQTTAKAIEAGLIGYGIQAQSIRDIVDEQMNQQISLLRLFEGFMGLGLIVGIAAVGVIAFRSVVERRQQIGMLRAIGYQQRLVAASFMLESLMMTLLGVISGTILGLLLAWNLFTSDFFGITGASFSVPWLDVMMFIVVALAAALLMAYIPARRAAGVSIAEALRYE